MKRFILLFTGLVITIALIFLPSLGCKGTEEIITGSITEEGRLLDKNGNLYSLLGDKADELKAQVGEKFEIKGMVKERPGKRTISIEKYVLLHSTPEQPYSTLEEPTEDLPASAEEDLDMEDDTIIEPIEPEPEVDYDLE